ncbi:MAG: hypothetical protein LBR11_07140 [Deltaproteobacteria bacterium]|jgi:hypothetical protein|nr:hypothetical protein [Deltaproteobacteria bacterium]
MSLSLALILIVGVPLNLLSLGVVLLSLKYYRARTLEPQTGELRFLTKTLERNLRDLETRVATLEDLILEADQSQTYHQ